MGEWSRGALRPDLHTKEQMTHSKGRSGIFNFRKILREKKRGNWSLVLRLTMHIYGQLHPIPPPSCPFGHPFYTYKYFRFLLICPAAFAGIFNFNSAKFEIHPLSLTSFSIQAIFSIQEIGRKTVEEDVCFWSHRRPSKIIIETVSGYLIYLNSLTAKSNFEKKPISC